MSCGDHHDLPCTDVAQILFLFIDNELEDRGQHHAVEIHFQECPPCRSVMEHEIQVLSTLKQALMNDCCEEAPEDLTERIRLQTAQLASAMEAGDPVQNWQFSHTQITTTIVDEFGNSTTIEIQSTTEIRGDF
jgi:predicted anti-sigma-YlaC factor YlaD